MRLGRAVDALRRGSGIRVTNGKQSCGLFPVECLDEALLARVRAHGSLLITGIRAQSLIPAAAADAVSIPLSSLSYEQVKALADPTQPQLPLPPLHFTAGDARMLQLVKYASLLPAVLVFPLDLADSFWPELCLDDLEHYAHSPLPPITQTASSRLPIKGAEDCEIKSFRVAYATSTHLLLVVGQPEQTATPLVRVHSSCITGDILGSLRCDCGDQLALALDAIKAEGAGLLIYLHQEGRGIGITNKIRAYQLQEMGVDTYEANRLLGYGEDERDFAIAAAILKKEGYDRIRLLTNNPSKREKLEVHGVTIVDRVPLVAPPGDHNHAYIEAKAKKAGHLF